MHAFGFSKSVPLQKQFHNHYRRKMHAFSFSNFYFKILFFTFAMSFLYRLINKATVVTKWDDILTEDRLVNYIIEPPLGVIREQG